MNYCKKCVMPDTRPNIHFNDEGICQACINYEKISTIDWDTRWAELEKLCDKYRGCNGDGWDCAIAASGGKDSHFQVHVLKDLLGMNPVILMATGFGWTETGLKNYENISEAFGCDILNLSVNRRANKIMSKKAFIELGSPMWYLDAAIYAYPYKMAMKLGLNLLVYGENVNYTYGGSQKEETPSALKQFENDVVKPIDFERWLGDGITMKNLEVARNPTCAEIKKAKLESIYLSYYVPWDTHENYEVAKRYGFHHLQHEWVREGTIEQYNSIDSCGYLISQWFKYPKYGHASATEMAARWIRAGMIIRDQAIPLVKKYDKHLDQRILDDYCNFIGITHKEFWEIADKWYNPDLFHKDRWGVWKEKFDLAGTASKKLEGLETITVP